MRQADAAALAWLLEVAPVTIRRWANRGWITRTGTDHRGRVLYAVDQVLELAERLGHAPPLDNALTCGNTDARSGMPENRADASADSASVRG